MSAGSASHFFFLFWGLAGFFSFERVSRLLCESFELLVAVGCFFFMEIFGGESLYTGRKIEMGGERLHHREGSNE